MKKKTTTAAKKSAPKKAKPDPRAEMLEAQGDGPVRLMPTGYSFTKWTKIPKAGASVMKGKIDLGPADVHAVHGKQRIFLGKLPPGVTGYAEKDGKVFVRVNFAPEDEESFELARLDDAWAANRAAPRTAKGAGGWKLVKLAAKDVIADPGIPDKESRLFKGRCLLHRGVSGRTVALVFGAHRGATTVAYLDKGKVHHAEGARNYTSIDVNADGTAVILGGFGAFAGVYVLPIPGKEVVPLFRHGLDLVNATYLGEDDLVVAVDTANLMVVTPDGEIAGKTRRPDGNQAGIVNLWPLGEGTLAAVDTKKRLTLYRAKKQKLAAVATFDDEIDSIYLAEGRRFAVSGSKTFELIQE
jgi:hypothetical protein